jgi:hypothetical protein
VDIAFITATFAEEGFAAGLKTIGTAALTAGKNILSMLGPIGLIIAAIGSMIAIGMKIEDEH